jgi:hypothetical protein
VRKPSNKGGCLRVVKPFAQLFSENILRRAERTIFPIEERGSSCNSANHLVNKNLEEPENFFRREAGAKPA